MKNKSRKSLLAARLYNVALHESENSHIENTFDSWRTDRYKRLEIAVTSCETYFLGFALVGGETITSIAVRLYTLGMDDTPENKLSDQLYEILKDVGFIHPYGETTAAERVFFLEVMQIGNFIDVDEIECFVYTDKGVF